MDISLFLAKALGLYLTIVSITMLINAANVRNVIKEIMNSPALFFLSAILALIMGILLVLSHNIWGANWRVIVTLTGWLALFKGVTNTLFPQVGYKIAAWFIARESYYFITTCITLFLGVLLLFCGFML